MRNFHGKVIVFLSWPLPRGTRHMPPNENLVKQYINATGQTKEDRGAVRTGYMLLSLGMIILRVRPRGVHAARARGEKPL